MRRTISLLLVVLAVLVAQSIQAQDAMIIPPLPDHVEVITPDNAHHLEHLAAVGRGEIRGMAWSPDESLFAVKSLLGVWIYEDLHQEPYLIEGKSESAVFDEAWNTLAIHNKGQVDIWNLQSREKQQVTTGAGQTVAAEHPVFITPDGSLVYFLVEDQNGSQQLWQWDVAQHQLKESLSVGSAYIHAVSMSPRGDALHITSSSDRFILLSGAPEFMPLPAISVTGLTFHPTEPIAAYFTRDHTESSFRLFNYETQQETPLGTFPHTNFSLFFSPSGDKLLAYAYDVDKLYEWDLAAGRLRTATSDVQLDRHVPQHNIQFSADGRFLMIAESSRRAIWDLNTLQPTDLGLTGFTDVRFSPAGGQLLYGRSLLSLEDRTLIRELDGGGSPAFSPTGKQLAVAQQDNQAVLIYPAAAEGDPVRLDGYGSFTSLGFSPQGGYLLTRSGRQLMLWEAPFETFTTVEVPSYWLYWPPILSGTDEVMRFSTLELPLGPLHQGRIEQQGGTFELHEERVFDLTEEVSDYHLDALLTYTVDADNDILVGAGGQDTGYYGGTPYLFLRDLASGRYQYIYAFSGQVNAVVFSPDKSMLATGNGYITEWYSSKDSTLRLWDIRRVDGVLELTERARFYYDQPVGKVVFNHTGRLIAVTAWYEISVRDTLTGREIFQQDVYRPDGLAFSPDGRLLLTKTNDGLQVWNLETGEALVTLPMLEGWSEVYFDPGGRWIVTSGAGVVRLYGIPGGD